MSAAGVVFCTSAVATFPVALPLAFVSAKSWHRATIHIDTDRLSVVLGSGCPACGRSGTVRRHQDDGLRLGESGGVLTCKRERTPPAKAASSAFYKGVCIYKGACTLLYAYRV